MPTQISDSGPNSFPEGRGETFNSVRGRLVDGAGEKTIYHIMNPAFQTHISVNANTETVVLSTTIDDRDEDQAILTDLEDTDIIWTEKFNDTTSYSGAGTYGITGVKINATPVGNDVDYYIKQTK